MTPPPRSPAQRTFYPLATALLVVAVLYWAKSVFIPVALAVLLAFALTPLSERLERRRLGRVPSALLVSAFALAVLGGLGWVAAVQVRNLSVEIPKHGPELAAKFGPLLRLAEAVDRRCRDRARPHRPRSPS